MIEHDENGEEWFGYTFSSEDKDPAAVMSTFTGNVQYVEWFFRQIVGKPKQSILSEQLKHLFDLLLKQAERARTDEPISSHT
jgi:hypothetical protein